MKLTIYFLTLMLILPFSYLWWWKKTQRLILGIFIIIIVIIGFFLPGELIYSIIAKEIDKEFRNKQKITNDAIEKAASEKVNSENSEKIVQAKKIVDLNKKLEVEENKNTLIYYQQRLLKKTWINKWKPQEYFSALLFCGQEFNDKLMSGGYEKIINYGIKIKIDPRKIIDCNLQNIQPKIIQDKIFETLKMIAEQDFDKEFSIICLKNIDSINPKLEKLILEEIFNNKSENSFWKFKDKDNKEIIVDPLRVIFIGTTSNSKLNNRQIHQKFHHIEPFLDKYFWTIILFSLGAEIVVFIMLVRSKKNSQNVDFQKNNY